MTKISDQYIRKVGLLIGPPLTNIAFLPAGQSNTQPVPGIRLDLSEFRVKFSTYNYDGEAPDYASIRVYNLATDVVNSIINNPKYSTVTLAAGYESGNYGNIFTGEIKQFKIGKEDNVTNYLDILASDGDVFYNRGFFQMSFNKGTTPQEQLMGAVEDYNKRTSELALVPGETPFAPLAVDTSPVYSQGLYNSTGIRGKVWVGLIRSPLRNMAANLNLTWSIQNGAIVLSDYQGYAEGTAVVLNSTTGLVGMPEQTDGGINCKCLLNPRIRLGGLVQLNNAAINQTTYSPNNTPAIYGGTSEQGAGQESGVPYNKFKGIQNLVPLSANDGYYRAYVVEHTGDTRGNDWYTNLTLLSVNIDQPVSMAVANI